ncbi:MAG: ABC transporter substrate-binding protein [Desulfuromonadales bacterium]
MIICGTLIFSVPQAVYATSPLDQIRTVVDQVIEVLRQDELQSEARRKVLSELIRSRFDFYIMSQRTLGQHWKKATTEEQAEFVSLFSDLLEASYTGRIEAYTDETVVYNSEKIDGSRAVVATVVQSNNAEIPIDYRMVKQGNDWFVYDVLVEDISLIKNYRSTYGEIVRKEGYAGLFERMRKKITELQDQPAADGGKT